MLKNILISTLVITNIYSCAQNINKENCFEINNQSYKYLDSLELIDSALFYNTKAYKCNPKSKNILLTRYSIYKKKKETLNVVNTLDNLINLKDSLSQKEKDWYKFAKSVLYIYLDETKYSDSIKSNYRYVSEKFDSLKKIKKNREDFQGIFDQKLSYTYYFEGKKNAQYLIDNYPSKYKFNLMDDYIQNDINPKQALMSIINMSDVK